MAEQLRMIELPFNQLELVQLELFLNREREADWVLVKVENNKFYFEKRLGEAYCYQVRLHIISHNMDEKLLTTEEKQNKFVKEQEQAGWQFMGQLYDWYIFRSLVERHPIVVERDWREEYRQLRKVFFKKEVLDIAGRSIVLFILLLSVSFFSPMAFVTSNYPLGIILACGMFLLLAIVEIKVWLEFKYKMHKKIRAESITLEENEKLIQDAYKRRRRMTFVASGALFVFWSSMMLDGIFLKSWRMILMTMLIVGVCLGGFIETIGERQFVEKYAKCGRALYIFCVVSLIAVAIANGLYNLQGTYRGEEAVQMKEEMRELSLVTLDVPYELNHTDGFIASKKQTSTLFLKCYVQYVEWVNDKYFCINYYEVRNEKLQKIIFEFLLRVKQIDAEHGYEMTNPESYGVDEAYIGDDGRSIYLRKGKVIIEIPYTSEKLTTPLWKAKFKSMYHKLETK